MLSSHVSQLNLLDILLYFITLLLILCSFKLIYLVLRYTIRICNPKERILLSQRILLRCAAAHINRTPVTYQLHLILAFSPASAPTLDQLLLLRRRLQLPLLRLLLQPWSSLHHVVAYTSLTHPWQRLIITTAIIIPNIPGCSKMNQRYTGGFSTTQRLNIRFIGLIPCLIHHKCFSETF